MARTYTSINHNALSSDTLAEANDATQALFWRLLCISDDWGRFPNNPAKVKRMMQDYSHSTAQIQEAINHFIKHESISLYEVEGIEICQWVKWHEFQTMRFHNEAQYPNPDGVYEPSDNPLAGKGNKRIITNHIISNHIISNAKTLEPTKAKHKGQHKPKDIPSEYLEFISEIFPGRQFTDVQLKKQVKALDQLIKKYGEHEVRTVLRWASQDENARGNWKGWKAVFHSIPRLVEDAHTKYLNMRSGYVADNPDEILQFEDETV